MARTDLVLRQLSGFPVNYLIIESLQKFHFYWGDDYKVEFLSRRRLQRLRRLIRYQ